MLVVVAGACASLTTHPGRHGDEGWPQLQFIEDNSYVYLFVIQCVFTASSVRISVYFSGD